MVFYKMNFEWLLYANFVFQYHPQDASHVEVDEGMLEAAKKQIQELEKALSLVSILTQLSMIIIYNGRFIGLLLLHENTLRTTPPNML